jgi:exodeoxyribonuclease V alpha subunit
MIDTLLMEALLSAVKPGSRIVIIGDSNQLPSVGAGNVLSEILDSERYRTVKLNKIFRQAGESLIVTNAHAINAGEDPELGSKRSDFFFIEREDEHQIADTVANLCVNRLPKKYGSELFGQIQVITPSHKGVAGTAALNIMLQQAINPPSPKKREKKHREVVFREGDRVMQVKNDYDIVWTKDGEEGCGIFNGDIGTVLSVLNNDDCMLIDFEGRLTRYELSMLDELEHAYAITVHKSQGSEYPYVVIPVYNCGDKLLTRNLLYTAVTRAQVMVILVGRPEIVHKMVQNNRQTKRYTGLAHMLSEEGNGYASVKKNR